MILFFYQFLKKWSLNDAKEISFHGMLIKIYLNGFVVNMISQFDFKIVGFCTCLLKI